MTKKITMCFEMDDEDYETFLERDDVQGDLREWVFAELCQNQDFGFLTSCYVEGSEEEEDD